MLAYLGDFVYGATIYVPFNTYDSNGASVTITGLATTDIEVYKNGSVTQRASDNGFTLLDTDGIDFDSTTGIHGFSIDTSDNSTAGFYAPGNEYFVIVNSITANTQTVRMVFSFSIENRPMPGLLARTTIASLSSQTSFTLTAGSADDDAYNGAIIVVQDAASVVQKAVGVISDYTGSSKTVTLLADPAIFTMATGDYVAIYADRSLKATVPTRTATVGSSGEVSPLATDVRTAVGLASANLDTQLTAIDDYIDTEVAAIKAKTDLIPGTQDGKTFAETVLLMAAALLGKASGLGTTTATFRSLDDAHDRIVATVDADGNRSAVTLDASSP